MAREPYLVLRDFRVWFQKRKGFLEALRRAEPDYIRAVDGIDLDIGRGEIYCLVGESGCGKTTTGKGILKLVEPAGAGVAIGLVATLPPLKPFPRKPILLMPIAILGAFLAQLFGLAIGMSLAGRPFDFDRLRVAP